MPTKPRSRKVAISAFLSGHFCSIPVRIAPSLHRLFGLHTFLKRKFSADGHEEAHKTIQNASKMVKIKCFHIFHDNFKVPWSTLDGFWKKFRSDPPHPVRTGPSIWPTGPNFCPDIHQAGIWLIGCKCPKPVRIGTKPW
ncbi:hypothetical protein L208DRAFT_98714 [Tricholoma matsutake]|nr:hypothetical protein L208DRAFT_98714 [Tricholoma matsutake 945]